MTRRRRTPPPSQYEGLRIFTFSNKKSLRIFNKNKNILPCVLFYNIYSIRNRHSHPLLFSSFSLRFVTPSTTNPYSIPFETLTLIATDRRHQTVSAAVSTLPCRRIHLPPTAPLSLPTSSVELRKY
ncbi:hypothetical protein P8452_51103 [Trifolium repens]|nr:hypothetical protein P8452_51103 [Trifolium repens]